MFHVWRESLNKDLQEMENWYYKLIIICKSDDTVDFSFPEKSFKKINVNLLVSEGLLPVSKEQYPLVVDDIFINTLNDRNCIYYLQHINILFDPQLKIHPIRLLENLSKTYKLVVEWPGNFHNDKLIYAKYGHPEYFTCSDYEGKIYCV